MALDFLNDIGNFLGGVSNFVSPVSSILGAIRGPQEITVPKPQTPASETYAISLLKAIAQPGNSLVKSLAAEELRNLMSAQQGDIRSKVLADRRERSMGRAPVFFDPERADENIAFQISRGGPMLAQQAQSNAIQRIMSAATGTGGFAGAQYGRSQDYQNALGAAREANIQNPMPNTLSRMNTGITGIQQILSTINNKTPAPTNTGYGGYGPFPSNYSLPGGENIRWNQMRY